MSKRTLLLCLDLIAVVTVVASFAPYSLHRSFWRTAARHRRRRAVDRSVQLPATLVRHQQSLPVVRCRSPLFFYCYGCSAAQGRRRSQMPCFARKSKTNSGANGGAPTATEKASAFPALLLLLMLSPATGLLPWSWAALASVLFVALRFFATQVVVLPEEEEEQQEEKDEESFLSLPPVQLQIDAVCFFFSFAAAALLAPYNESGEAWLVPLLLAGGILAATQLLAGKEEGSADTPALPRRRRRSPSPEEELMDLWDRRLEREDRQQRRKGDRDK